MTMKTTLQSPFLDAETSIGAADEADWPGRGRAPPSPYVQDLEREHRPGRDAVDDGARGDDSDIEQFYERAQYGGETDQAGSGNAFGDGPGNDGARADGDDYAEQPEREYDLFEHAISEIDRQLNENDRRVLLAAIGAGEHDDGKLTNLLFFDRHPELDPTRPLDHRASKADTTTLAAEWSAINQGEVWPALEAAANYAGFDDARSDEAESEGDGFEDGEFEDAAAAPDAATNSERDDEAGWRGPGAPDDEAGDELRMHEFDPAPSSEASAPFEHVLPQPNSPARRDEVAQPRHLYVVDADNARLAEGEYTFVQGGRRERGSLKAGMAFLGGIDPSRPFQFEVRDRVCMIQAGAYLDPDDHAIEYGGTCFDWTLVRDNRNPEQAFWPHYQREMDRAARDEPGDSAQGRRLDLFAQHEHITRRPIQVVPALHAQPGQVRIRAVPVQLRAGPFVRYADHMRAVIWLESVTPCIARVCFRKTGTAKESWRYASTVRVGGRHFAAVELDLLDAGQFYDYTLALAPLPVAGPIPYAPADLEAAFPALTPAVAAAMKKQCKAASLKQTEWLGFRTLLPRYDGALRFATGSCRWYPGDESRENDRQHLAPDMLDGLGQWLHDTPKERWPQFLFFSGDQIYADEIGDDHARMITNGRFAARIPGPGDPAASARSQLVDGAWAGRFAHRYRAYKPPPAASITSMSRALGRLDDIRKRYPDIDGITREYPDLDPEQALRMRYDTAKNRRTLSGAKGEADDERRAREAIALLPTVRSLAMGAEPSRPFLPQWGAASGVPAARRQFLSHNFLLWNLPGFGDQLPTVAAANLSAGVRTPGTRGHPSVAGGRHAADFAEYAYLYERAWTSSRQVRMALAHVPTFLIFDDHELTDDWNFSAEWVRMLHNPNDELRMWPKTLTDGLAAYWLYQGWCNKAPSQWPAGDPRVKAMSDAQRQGTDALPALRKCIHGACFAPPPSADPNAPYQAGLGLDWHYRLPFEPPFLVPDCRSRKLLVPADDKLRVIEHDGPVAQRPQSRTIDKDQLDWMRTILVDRPATGPVAFIGTSTPLLLQNKFMDFMLKPEVAAGGWASPAVGPVIAALFSSTLLGTGKEKLLTIFRRSKDLEHIVRDKTWRDFWSLADAMRKKKSQVKTLVLLSGDVHHSYCMTATLPGAGRPQPEVLQITSSGLRTTIRGTFKSWFAGQQSWNKFNIGGIQLAPGFLLKNDAGDRQVALYENAVALVDVTIGTQVGIVVTHLSGKDRYVYRYKSDSR
jgi:hypothetical protein